MAGRSDIQAGKAYVTLYTKNSQLVKGINEAKKTVGKLGSSLMGIGKLMLGVSAGLIAPMAAAIAHFENAGSKLNDLSERTGVAAGALGELGYAASQSGSDIDTLAASFIKLDKLIAAAYHGDKSAIKFFAHIGISVGQLRTSKPDEVMDRIADSIANTSDPAERARIAMEAFGKSGAALIPMLAGGSAGLRRMREEARELGSLTTEEAKAADEFGDSLGRLRTVLSNTAAVIGSRLVDHAREFVDIAILAAKDVLAWVRSNGQLLNTAGRIAIALGAAGAAVLALGAGLSAVSGIMTTVTGLITIGGIVAPFVQAVAVTTLLAGAIAGIVQQLGGMGTLTNWIGQSFQAVGDYFGEVVGNMSANFSTMWQGIVDSVAAGDLGQAMEVAWAGLQLIWLQGTQQARTVWNSFSYGVASQMIEAFAAIQTAWVNAVYAMRRVWNFLQTAVTLGWNEMQQGFESSLIGMLESSGAISSDMANAWRNDMNQAIKQSNQQRKTNHRQEVNDADKWFAESMAGINPEAAQKELLNDFLKQEQDAQQRIDDAKSKLGKQSEKAASMAATVRLGNFAGVAAPDVGKFGDIKGGAAFLKTQGPTFSANAAMSMGGNTVEKAIKEASKATVEMKAKLERQTQAVEKLERNLKIQFVA